MIEFIGGFVVGLMVGMGIMCAGLVVFWILTNRRENK